MDKMNRKKTEEKKTKKKIKRQKSTCFNWKRFKRSGRMGSKWGSSERVKSFITGGEEVLYNNKNFKLLVGRKKINKINNKNNKQKQNKTKKNSFNLCLHYRCQTWADNK